MSENSPVLQVNDLSHFYSSPSGKLPVLTDIQLGLMPTEMVAIQGNSGSGKTTLLLACGAMLQPKSGSVELDQKNLYELSEANRNQLRSEKIGFMFQTMELIPYLNIIDNVRLAKNVSRGTASQWIQKVGLSDRAKHRPQSLSHGQRQRAALARALAHNPLLAIADEPTGNLDTDNRKLVYQTFRDFANRGGAVLIASHDPDISNFVDRVVRLENGILKS